MSTHAFARRGLTGILVAALVATPLSLGLAAPAQADVSAKITPPYSQDWSNPDLITVTDVWTGVPGVQGYRGDDLTAVTGADPQTLTADGSATPTNVLANATTTSTTGGLIEVPGAIGMQGSGTADAPHLVFHLNLTGKTGTTFAFTAKDLDGGADDAAQQVAVQYRVGGTGAYTNLPAGYIADATTAITATQTTAKSVPLPAAADNQASVFVRVMTTNAVGNDELVGIDDIAITSGAGASPLAATNPGTQTATVDQAIAPITLNATGGQTPYTWGTTALPAGLSLSGNTISGTPTASGTTSVTATVTDNNAATAPTTFDIVVNPAASVTPIATIQGTPATQGAGASSPLNTQTVTTEGVVTGFFVGSSATNGGIYVQTGGTGGATDATPDASDAIFVFGGNSRPAGIDVGDSVRVTGVVSEFGTLTQITPAAGGVSELATPLAPVTAASLTYPATDAGREAHESELLAPTGPFTVSNVFNITGGGSAFAEIGLAAGTTPLVQPTDVEDAQTGNPASVTAANAARAVALDDGSGVNFMSAANRSLPLPWITGNANPPRVGAPVTFTAPVVLDYRNNTWKFQPQQPVTGNGAGTATFGTDRAANLAPADVGGDLKISTFNVLNYFPTTGQAHVAAGGTCSYFNDRAGTPIANDSCNPNGPRGAATQVSFLRQQEKIVDAINTIDADIISLEELENSVKMIGQTDRDAAIGTLVAALNADTALDRWAFAPSPAAADLPTPAEEDVIRTGFIYQPATVELVGASVVLKDEVNFDNAREPLAQAFKPAGDPDSAAFGVIVNHFKSKGSACTSGNDPIQGNCNGDRIGQAEALRDFAESFRTARSIDDLFLVGDFNSYTQEDPMQVLYAAGYTNITSDDDSDASYSFGGLAGSLDHVLGNAAATESVTGSDIWEINANESLAYQYARYNYHGEIYHSDSPWSSSDHNPEVIGISSGEPATREIQVLGINDFHGRILNNAGEFGGAPGSPSGTPAGPNKSSDASAGAAILSGAVKQLRGENPDTVFAAAGDLIGASTFESFIQDDEPTIDALNEAGLEVSAAGNHEFDQGYEDLVGRVQDRADWEYLAANVQEPAGRDDLAESWTKDFGSVRVGFVGAVTEDLPTLVSPGGIEGVTVTDIVAATNAEADALKAAGADVVVLLVHEGAPSPSLADATTNVNAFSEIVNGVNANVDAIVSGHTHLAYNHSVPVPAWVTQGRAVTERPVVSAGQYGQNLNKLVFTVDTATGAVQAKTQSILPLKANATTPNYPADPAIAPIVADAVEQAAVLGAQVLGRTEGAFYRAKLVSGTENRGGESTLGNLVAEIQRYATQSPTAGGAQVAFMNAGGLRADLLGTVNGASRDVSFREAAEVQPFANTLVNMDLTGAQIETALEQQWQAAGASRPFLKLGSSEGFTYTYAPPAAGSPAGTKGEVLAMYLDGELIEDGDVLSVTVNSFLSTGGDGFAAFTGGAGKQDTGKTDLQAQVDYFDEFASTSPLAVDYSQRAVGVTFPAGAPVSYPAGSQVTFDLSSLSMTGRQGNATTPDPVDTAVNVEINGRSYGPFDVTTTYQTALPGFDEVGRATVTAALPLATPPGTYEAVITGATTGTEVTVPLTVTEGATREIQVLGINDFHGRILNNAGEFGGAPGSPSGTPAGPNKSSDASAGAAILSGAVKQLRGENPDTVFAAAGDLIGASTFESFIQDDEPTIDALNEAGLEVSAAGNHEFDQGYEDLVGRVQDRADWEYLAANVQEPAGRDDLAESWTKDFGSVRVGFVGAVTEDLPTLVSPGGIEGVTVTDIVAATNAEADALKAAGADVVVLLVHEGAPSPSLADATTNVNAFSEIVNGVNANVDAIVSGHTHLAYNHSVPVPAWVTQGRAVTERPVVSAGQYGQNLNKLVFTVDTATGAVQAKTQSILPLKANATTPNYPADPAIAPIVADAVEQAAVLGAQVLGRTEGAFYRAKLVSGTENRGGESTLGNLVAEIQRYATQSPTAGGAQVAFMNAGGLRADLLGTVNGASRDVSFREAAEVQPFANTLVNMDLTGAQIETALEQQWQAAGASRPFLKLGSSEGFTYTYAPPAAGSPAGTKGEVLAMYLDGELIEDGDVLSVTVNSFLSTGGDGFAAFTGGAGKQDTGKTDLQAQVDYFDEFASTSPLAVDYSQRAVGVTFPAGAPASYPAGSQVTFDLSSLSMTGRQGNATTPDPVDTAVNVEINGRSYGPFDVTTTYQTALPGFDEVGRATVTAALPLATPPGTYEAVITGATTGTEVTVPLVIDEPIAVDTSVTGTAGDFAYGQPGSVAVSVDPSEATGSVELRDGATVLGTGTLDAGSTSIVIPALALEVGTYTLDLVYLGDLGFAPSTGTVTVTVTKAASTVSAVASPARVQVKRTANEIIVSVRADGYTPTGFVQLRQGDRTLVLGTLDAAGDVALPLGPYGGTGTFTYTAAYVGDARTLGGTADVSVTVVRQGAGMSVTAPKLVKARARPPVRVVMTGVGATVTGRVAFRFDGRNVTRILNDGKASFRLPPSTRRTTVVVRYLGSSVFVPTQRTVVIRRK